MINQDFGWHSGFSWSADQGVNQLGDQLEEAGTQLGAQLTDQLIVSQSLG
jgi:hypothetical protein